MRRISLTLSLMIFGLVLAVAHPGHRSTPHIHLTESLSIGIGVILFIAFALVGFYFFKKSSKKKNCAK